jgi:hypothetical protein
MSFVQASPLSERPRDLLNQKNGARLFGTPVRLIISSFLLVTMHTSFEVVIFLITLRGANIGGLPQQSNCSEKAPNEDLRATVAWRRCEGLRHAPVNEYQLDGRPRHGLLS